MKSSEIAETMKFALSDDYRSFIDDARYDTLDGCRPRNGTLPWADSMHYPLCFDPETVLEVCDNSFIWNSSDPVFDKMIPLAVFYNENSTDQLNSMDDFIAARMDAPGTCTVHLWDHEGYFSPVSESLEEFLKTLIPVDDPEWKMEE